MDLPVEATVNLESFPDKAEAKSILMSHGFKLKDLGNDRVRVKGSFLNLKAAKASLEQRLTLQSKRDITSFPSSPASSGAVPKQYTNTDDTRGRSGSRNSRPLSSEQSDFSSLKLERSASFGAGKESFFVHPDVLSYANQLRKKDIDNIQESHNVIMQVHEETQDTCEVTLMGKSAKLAAGKIQSLLGDLNKTLRTQEVLKTDMDHEGRALLESIQKHRNVWNSVVVCVKNDTVHLIGSSRESYELKQRLMGNRADQSGRTGRTLEKNTVKRSQSLPPRSRNDTERDRATNTVSAGAEGDPSLMYLTRAHAEPERTTVSCFNALRIFRRSQSESRKRVRGRANGHQQEPENKVGPAKAPKALSQLLPFTKDDKKQFKIRSKRKNEPIEI